VLTIPLRIPPLIPTANALNTTHAAGATGPLARDAAIVLIFALAVAALGSRQWRRCE